MGASPFRTAIGALLLAIGIPVVLLSLAQLAPRSAQQRAGQLARIPRFHHGETASEPVIAAPKIEIAAQPDADLSGSVASAETVNAPQGIRIASRDPDALSLGPPPPVAKPVPVPDWVADVQPFEDKGPRADAEVEAKPSVELNVLPFDVRTAMAEADRRDEEWRERFRALEARLDALNASRLEEQSRRLELQERDRRLDVLEAGLQELQTSPRVESGPPPTIQVRRTEGEPVLFDLEARQAELGEVFQQLAQAAGVEVIVNPDVQGRASILLKQKTLEDLLSLLASSQGCEVQREGDLWRVGTAAPVDSSSPEIGLESRTFVPRHLAAVELAEFLRPLLTPERGQISALAAGGSADGTTEPHGVLMVRDSTRVLAEVEQTLQQFDVPLVEIELQAQVFSVDLAGAHAKGVTLTGGRIVKQVPIPCPVCGGSHETMAAITTVSSPSGEFVQAPGGLKYAFVKGDGQSVAGFLNQTGATHPIGSPRVKVRNRQPVELVLSSLSVPVVGAADESMRRLRVQPTALGSREFELTIEESQPYRGSGTEIRSAEVKLVEGTTVILGGIVEQTGGTNREILVLLTPRLRGEWPAAAQTAGK